MRIPVVVLVGRPNVGKSTLFNRLVGRRRAIVTDEPGVTRDRLYGSVDTGRIRFRLIDTGGLAPGGTIPLQDEVEGQVRAALAESDAVLVVVNVRDGVNPLDESVADLVRRSRKPTLVVANKADVPIVESLAQEFHKLGLGEPLPVSAEHGVGIAALLEHVTLLLPELPTSAGAPGGSGESAPVRVAVVGRPNVGKSSLVNRLVGEERVVVSETPGTTRDAVDILIERGGRAYHLVDTAGIRRGGRQDGRVEFLSATRAKESIERSDVAVLVLDATAGIVAQDTHIAGYARTAFRPVVLVVNKWDLVEGREEEAKRWAEEAAQRLRFVKETPMLFISARTGQRVARLLEIVDQVHAAGGIRVPTPHLNRWLQEAARDERGAPAAGHSIRLFYATQTGVHPPRFVLFCNDAQRVHFSLRRRLENGLRARFGFGPAPIRIQFRSRREAARP